MEFILPDSVMNILSRLNTDGFSAFVAGGAVRDTIMGKTPHDYDIATSARPEEVKKLFRRTIDTGIKHGTVTVVHNKTGYEVTTFRTDGEYSDGRHPQSVCFVDDAREDCARRDFTINAMMYLPKTGIIDYFGGQHDIENKIIRCVGNPEKRFKEDALRMLRAIRFSAVLSFRIEDETWKAIKKCAVLIKKVSHERILEEVNKILLSENPDYIRKLHECGLLQYIMPELERCFGEPQRNKYHIYDVGEHIMHTVKCTPNDLVLRWAALMHDIGKPKTRRFESGGKVSFHHHDAVGAKMTRKRLKALHFDHHMVEDVSELVNLHLRFHGYVEEPWTDSAVRRYVKDAGPLYERLNRLTRADTTTQNKRKAMMFSAAMDEMEQRVRDLKEKEDFDAIRPDLNGDEIMQLLSIEPGPMVGKAYKHMLEYRLDNGPVERDVAVAELERWYKEQGE